MCAIFEMLSLVSLRRSQYTSFTSTHYIRILLLSLTFCYYRILHFSSLAVPPLITPSTMPRAGLKNQMLPQSMSTNGIAASKPSSKTNRSNTGVVAKSSKKPSPSEVLNQFSPTLLPEKVLAGSESIQHRFNESLSIGTKMDFTLLSYDNCLVWLKFFSDTVVKLNNECTLLRGQLDQYRDRASSDIEHQAKLDFVGKVIPAIKTAMFPIFVRLIFPSQLEVTSSRDRRALLSFGLSEKCDLATLVFDTAVFFKNRSPEGNASKPVKMSEDPFPPLSLKSPSASLHPFDTPEIREQLWFELGVGTFAVKQLNAARNTYTNLIREVVSKYFEVPMLSNVHFLFCNLTLCSIARNLFLQKICSSG